MNLEKTERALAECRRFQSKGEAALRAAGRQQRDTRERLNIPKFNQTSIDACKESGALRRASMDLTRALSDLRKPG